MTARKSSNFLPLELGVLTLEFLNSSDIFACQEVCKGLHAVAETCKRRRIFSKRIESQLEIYLQSIFNVLQHCELCKTLPVKGIKTFIRDTPALLSGSFVLWCIERPVESRERMDWWPTDLDYFIPRDILERSFLREFVQINQDELNALWPEPLLIENLVGDYSALLANSRAGFVQTRCPERAPCGLNYVLFDATKRLMSSTEWITHTLSEFDLGICQLGYQASSKKMWVLNRQDIKNKEIVVRNILAPNSEDRISKYEGRGYRKA